MNKTEKKNYHRMRRHNRIRAKISGTGEKPRLAVFRSARYIIAQLIDDTKGLTILEASDLKTKTGTKMERAAIVGKAIAEKAKTKKITHVVFDRGGFLYTGRVKSLADACREGGLTF